MLTHQKYAYTVKRERQPVDTFFRSVPLVLFSLTFVVVLFYDRHFNVFLFWWNTFFTFSPWSAIVTISSKDKAYVTAHGCVCDGIVSKWQNISRLNIWYANSSSGTTTAAVSAAKTTATMAAATAMTRTRKKRKEFWNRTCLKNLSQGFTCVSFTCSSEQTTLIATKYDQPNVYVNRARPWRRRHWNWIGPSADQERKKSYT